MVEEASPADLGVYDMGGRLIEKLHQGQLDAGLHQFQFAGANLPTGVYIYRASIAGKVLSGKALLIK